MKILSAFVVLCIFMISTISCVGSVFAHHYLTTSMQMQPDIVNFGLIAANLFLFIGMMAVSTILLSKDNGN
jgi:hypothetical protein